VSTLKNVNEEAFYEQQFKEGFPKFPSTNNFDRDARFFMCCCCSELPHNESQKILCMGNLERTIFMRYPDGDQRVVKEGDPFE
jgi:hypothetical protein